MEAKLQAGIELVLEKEAREEAGTGLLAAHINQGVQKLGMEEQVVQQEHASVNLNPSSKSSDGMEDKNEQHGKGSEFKLDDDPSKGRAVDSTQLGNSAQNRTAGTNVTVETKGMPNLEIGTKQHDKQASSNLAVLRTMLRGIA